MRPVSVVLASLLSAALPAAEGGAAASATTAPPAAIASSPSPSAIGAAAGDRHARPVRAAAMSDAQLDDIVGQGLVVHLDLSLDVGNQTSLSDQAATQVHAGLAQAGLTPSAAPGQPPPAGGVTITGNALQGTNNLFNVVVQGGNVGIGVNIQVIVNPTNSSFVLSSQNANFAQLLTVPGR